VTCFVQSQYLLSTLTEFANTTAKTFRIDKFDARNTDTSPRSVTVHIVPQGGAPDTSTIRLTDTVQPSDTRDLREIVGHDLDPGDALHVLASVDSVVSIRISGRYV
jgi:hypothetical protein